MHDYSLFYRKQNSSIVFIAVYVDDVLLIGTDSEEIDQLKAFLHDKFRIKDLGQLHYFLGLEILYKLDGIIISQRKFVLDLLKDYVCLHCPSLTSPLDSTTKSKAKEGAPLSDPTFYRKLIGKLNFLTNTRLDIAYGVQHLSQFMQDPREPHLKAAYHMLRFLKGDPTMGLYFSNKNDLSLAAYCDSDWQLAQTPKDQCLNILCSWEEVQLVGNPRNKKPSLFLQQRQNIEPLEKLLVSLFGCPGCLKNLLCQSIYLYLFIAIAFLLYTLLGIMCSMKGLSILKLIVTLCAPSFKRGSFHYIMLALANNLQMYSLRFLLGSNTTP